MVFIVITETRSELKEKLKNGSKTGNYIEPYISYNGLKPLAENALSYISQINIKITNYESISDM